MTDVTGGWAGQGIGARQIEFTGEVLPLLGRTLAVGLASVLVIPIPWVSIWYYRWWISQLHVSDGSTLEFRGTVGQIWLPLIGLIAIGLIPQLLVEYTEVAAFAPLIILPVQAYLFYVIISWFTTNVHPSSGTTLSFHGSWLALMGWWLLMFVSVFTIIGIAWVYAAMGRWCARNIRGGGNQLQFSGSGLEILWRTIAVALASCLFIPIPWVMLWHTKWIVSQFSVVPAEDACT